MAVKRIIAADMQTALTKIRNQFGADAEILATRHLSEGVEVSVAPASATRGVAEQEQPAGAEQSGYPGPAGLYSEQQDQSGLQSELGGMRSMLQRWMEKQGWEDYTTRSPTHAKLWECLRRLGLPGSQVSKVINAVSDYDEFSVAWRNAIDWLGKRIATAEEDMVAAGGVFAFLGAAGAGKTACIAKLATRCVLTHGAESVALVTTDRYRLAAHEQLRTIGRILGVSVRVVDEDNSLDAILSSHLDTRLVLIDTAGLNSLHPQFNHQLQQLRGRPITSLLVLSATSQLEVQRSELAAYADSTPQAAIITKIDEAASMGESLGLLLEQDLPIAYCCDGQAVPDDIAVMNGQQLVESAVLLSKNRAIDSEQLTAGFDMMLHTPQRAMAVTD